MIPNTGGATNRISEAERIRRTYDGHKDVSRWSGRNPGNQYNARMRNVAVQELLQGAGMLPLTGKRVLEVGSGVGGNLAALEKFGARREDLHGVDLRPDAVKAAQGLFPGIHFTLGNGEGLDFEDGAFDLVLLFVVFSSIPDDAIATRVAGEAVRVLRPGGCILWYDMRYANPRNKNVRPFREQQITALFPGLEHQTRTTTLIPQIARRLGPLTGVLHPLLAAMPPLRSHNVCLLRKPEAGGI